LISGVPAKQSIARDKIKQALIAAKKFEQQQEGAAIRNEGRAVSEIKR
jgi:hypothetical protein